MTIDQADIIGSFRKKVCDEIEIEPEGLHRFIVYTPFMFDDGDHFVVILRRKGDKWFLTDEGHTLMHLTYGGVDIARGSRARIVEESLAAHGVENNRGELILGVPDGEFGDALFSYLQALARTTTVPKMTMERVASTFMEDFRSLITESLPAEHIEFDWFDPVHDPDKKYVVDCRINERPRPFYVFAINSDLKCSNATASCLMLERRGLKFAGIAFFEEQESIGRKYLAQLTDVVDKQFSSLGDRQRIQDYFKREMSR
jgi:hypothetical protein